MGKWELVFASMCVKWFQDLQYVFFFSICSNILTMIFNMFFSIFSLCFFNIFFNDFDPAQNDLLQRSLGSAREDEEGDFWSRKIFENIFSQMSLNWFCEVLEVVRPSSRGLTRPLGHRERTPPLARQQVSNSGHSLVSRRKIADPVIFSAACI